MSNHLSLSAISDHDLLARLQDLRRRERETTLEILRHLNEVERRHLHMKLGYSSMFVYCTGHLRYSESAAGRRVQAARCLRQFPQVATLLERGDINISTLGLVASLLTERTAGEILERIRGKSQRQVEEFASSFRPPIQLRDRVQRVNVAVPSTTAGAAGETAAPPSPTEPVKEATAPLRPVPVPNPVLVNEVPNSRCGSEKSPNVPRVEPKLYIQFLADDTFMRSYNEACSLLSHRIPKASFAAVFGTVLEDFLNRHSPDRRQERRNGRDTKAEARKPRANEGHARRAIPARMRDAVFVRDRGQCTYVGAAGRRCSETRGLQIDHITPVARNGTNDPGNLRLLCGRHNRLEAGRVLGEDRMKPYGAPGG